MELTKSIHPIHGTKIWIGRFNPHHLFFMAISFAKTQNITDMETPSIHLKIASLNGQGCIQIEQPEKLQRRKRASSEFDLVAYLKEVKTPHIGLMSFIK